MPRKTSLNVVSVTVKVPKTMVDDADLVAKGMPNAELSSTTRTDILRIAMRLGLDSLLIEQRGQKPSPHPSGYPKQPSKKRTSDALRDTRRTDALRDTRRAT